MMINIKDLMFSDYNIKEGDIKVNANDFKRILALIDTFYSLIMVNIGMLEEQEKSELLIEKEFVEYIQNKYIVLGDLRYKQKQWYDILQKFNDKDFTSSEKVSADEVDTLRREVWGYYVEAKKQREKLQAELDQLDMEKSNNG